MSHWGKSTLALTVFMVSAAASFAMEDAAPDEARSAVFRHVISGLQGKACLAVRPVSRAASAIQASDAAAVLAEVRGATEDPSHLVMSALTGHDVVAMSKCPEQHDPRRVYHVVEGALLWLPSGRVQLAVSVNMDGLPSVYLCEVAPQKQGWAVQQCTLVVQS